MFLREGSQRRLNLTTAYTVALTTIFAVHAAADDAVGNSPAGVELPREVLPWRRDVEHRASALLAVARQSQRVGNGLAAERQLRELIQKFPDTHAAADGGRELAALRERFATSSARRGLGVPPPLDRPGARAPAINPVAGWQTIVTPDPGNLREAFIEAAGDRVFFDEGSSRLTRRSRSVLAKQARWLKSQPNIDVRVVGHADDKGTPESNMRLSHDRAATVRKRLIRSGIAPRRLHIFSHGKARPIAICTVGTCAAQNRRVVMEIRTRNRSAAAFD